jgi:PTS system nitrogen regulatory IIA component
MNSLATLLRPAHIELDLRVADKLGLFAHLADQAAPLLDVPARNIVDSFKAREALGSTGLGMGVAIPHGRLKGLKDAAVFFCRLNPALDFEALDARPVNLVFALLVPASADELHLQLLGELAQHLGSAAFRQRLADAPDAAAVVDAFSTSEA